MPNFIFNKKYFYLFLGLGILYVLPIILANNYYTDDMARITHGGGWHHDGRFIATHLARIFSFSSKITALYPYSLIVASGVVILSGMIVTYVLDLDSKWTLAPLFILISPFLLENLAYRFDALYMCLSILLAVIPFLYWKKRRFFLISILCLVLVMGLYQTTAMLYIAIMLLIQLKLVLDNKSIEWKLLVVSLVSFVLAFIAYKVLLKISGIQVGRSSFLPLSLDSLEIIKNRLLQYYILLKQLVIESRYWYALTPILFLGFIGLFYNYFKTGLTVKLFIKIWFTIILLLGLLGSILLPNLILVTMWLTARTLIVFPVVYFCIFIFIDQLTKLGNSTILRKVILVSSIILVFFSFLLSSVFGTILKNNEEYQNYLATNITHSIFMSTDRFDSEKNLSLMIIGSAPKAPTSQFLYGRYPIMNKLAPNYLTQGWFWGLKKLSIYYNFSWPDDRNFLERELCNLPVVEKTFLYDIRREKNNFIVDFRQSCK